MSGCHAEHALLPDGVASRRASGRRRSHDGVASTARAPAPASAPRQRRPTTTRPCPASTIPGWPTATATPSTARCAGAPSRAAARSGPGASRCTPWPRGLDPGHLPRARPRRPTPRWCWPASPRVGEFHYLHHQPDGTPYDDPNAMGRALLGGRRRRGHPDHAARHLLPRRRAIGPALPLEGVQRRFSDGDVDAWARAASRRCSTTARADRRRRPLGARRAARPARRGRRGGRAAGPLHVHLSEQLAENDACLAATTAARRRGCSPTPARSGPDDRGPRHPPHRRRRRAARRRAAPTVCFCPTTERDLGRRHRPGPRAARRRGAAHPRLRQHAVIDLFEEMRGLEIDERLRHPAARALVAPAELLAAAPATGTRRSAGRRRPDRGRAARRPGRRRPRHRPHRRRRRREQVVLAATAADVDAVVVDGRRRARRAARARRRRPRCSTGDRSDVWLAR